MRPRLIHFRDHLTSLIWLALYTGWVTWLHSAPMKASIPYRMVHINTLRSCSIVRVSFALTRAAFDFFWAKCFMFCKVQCFWQFVQQLTHDIMHVWLSCLCFTSKESSEDVGPYSGTGLLLEDLFLFWIRGSLSVDSFLLDSEKLLYSPLSPSAPCIVVLCGPGSLLFFSCIFPGSVRKKKPAAEQSPHALTKIPCRLNTDHIQTNMCSIL